MLDYFIFEFILGIPYLVFLVVGVWVCLLDYRSQPTAYRFGIAALVYAMFAWFARPFLVDTGPSAQHSLGMQFINSLLDGGPIILLALAILKLLRSARQSVGESDLRESPTVPSAQWSASQWLLGSLGLLLLVLLATIAVVRLTGAVPYLLFLGAAIAFFLLNLDQNPTALKLTTCALATALVACLIRPWIVDLLNPSLDYPTTGKLNSVLRSLGNAVPLGLLLWVVFSWPTPPDVEDPPQPFEQLGFKVLGFFGWAILGGIAALMLYIGGVFVCGLLGLLPPTGDPSRGGSGGVEYLVIAFPVLVVGVLGGVIFAGYRGQTRTSKHER